MKYKKYLYVAVLMFFVLNIVNASDSSTTILSNISTSTGSNNGLYYFSTLGILKQTIYYNKDSNVDIIGNYLGGYYYNNLFGYFQLDWNQTDTSSNVSIVGTTSKCSNNSYGYKFSGFAKSDTSGLIDFSYDDNNFVYYCLSDNKLHGKAYSKAIGFQNFEGLSFDIFSSGTTLTNITNTGGGLFVNNTSIMFINNNLLNKDSSVTGNKSSVKYGDESIFYIFKPNK
ncbi:MAG: hypothetical protein PHE25_04195 [Candidatus Gracilibacteria bacterium]|nr:hypothetical protein [Candidatus Gracilibacteria bacterium]